MKTKIRDHSKNTIAYIRKVCKSPSPPMLDVYNNGGSILFANADFIRIMHLAINLSEKYRSANLPIWTSRELEMLTYDMHLKGYSLQEMIIVCSVASHNQRCEQAANKVFSYLSDLIMKSAKQHGDMVLQVSENIYLAQRKQTNAESTKSSQSTDVYPAAQKDMYPSQERFSNN